MNARRPAATAVAAAAAAALLAACAQDDMSSDGAPPLVKASDPGRPAPGVAGPTAEPRDARPAGARLAITVEGQSFTATLQDSAATRDLLGQLPLTLDMTDHGGVEKTGPLPAPLSVDGQPDTGDPQVGDVGYYGPGNDLVLYYGDQSAYPGIVVLGRLDGDAGRLASIAGAVSARVSPLTG